MKTNVLRTSILALVAAAGGYAQSPLPVHATIPFSYVAGETNLAAGQYTVNQSHRGMIILKSADGKAGGVLLSDTVQRPRIQTVSTLVFHRYGNVYFLTQVWTEGADRGRQATVSRRERELEARHKTPDETFILALR